MNLDTQKSKKKIIINSETNLHVMILDFSISKSIYVDMMGSVKARKWKPTLLKSVSKLLTSAKPSAATTAIHIWQD